MVHIRTRRSTSAGRPSRRARSWLTRGAGDECGARELQATAVPTSTAVATAVTSVNRDTLDESDATLASASVLHRIRGRSNVREFLP